MLKVISKFLFRFSAIRFLRSFFYSKIYPWLKYLYYFLILALIVFIPYFVVKKSDYLLGKYVTAVGGGGNFYQRVKISGNRYTDYDILSKIVSEEIAKQKSNNAYNDAIIEAIKGKIELLPWVRNVVISRNLPSDLLVKIEEHEPFAIWQDSGKKYIIDKNGKIIVEISDAGEFSNLLILAGKGANSNARSLFNILVIDLEISQDVYSASWVGSRRWDIVFNNNLLVKLPENNIDDAWQKLVKIYKTPGSLIDLKTIDLRIENKVYLQYEGNSIKDLKLI